MYSNSTYITYFIDGSIIFLETMCQWKKINEDDYAFDNMYPLRLYSDTSSWKEIIIISKRREDSFLWKPVEKSRIL